MRTHFLKNLEAFVIDGDEKTLYAGNWGGQIAVVDVDSFRIVGELQAHAGVIHALALHPTLPYLATSSSDQSVRIWNVERPGVLTPHLTARLGDLPRDGFFQPPTGGSQALCFHPTERRLLINASPGVAELEFDDEDWEPRFVQRGYFKRLNGGESEAECLRYLPGGERGLFTSGDGRLVVVDLAAPAQPLLRWEQERVANLHWVEPVEGTEYLIASDWRRIIRFDASGGKEAIFGPKTPRDDVEVVRYNPVSKRAYATSFDRVVHQLDPESCEVIGVAVRTPFKLRGLATLRRDPDLMVIQCRNGALYKVDLGQKKLLGTIKETPNAVWTSAVTSDHEMFFAGEGNALLRAEMKAAPDEPFATRFESTWHELDIDPGVYTKRMVHHAPTKTLVLGRTDGTIVCSREGGARTLITLESPLRDLDVSPEGFDLYAVTELGDAYRIDLESGRVLGRFHSPKDEPFWSLAYNHARHVLCVVEREGNVHFLDADTMALKSTIEGTERAKRIRWFDDDRLFLAQSNEVLLLNVANGHAETKVGGLSNTIEDFDWDASGRYLAIVTYDQSLYLCEMDMTEGCETVRRLAEPAKWDHGYVKGVRWLPPGRGEGAYPYELVVYGRSGWIQHFRLLSERAFHVGTVNQTLSDPVVDRGVTVG